MELKALKPFRYNKVALKPGDVFTIANDKHATILTTSVQGKMPLATKVESYGTRSLKAENEAEKADSRRPEAPDDSAQSKEDHTQDRASLRAEYEALYGKRPFPGWNADQLKEKIRYKRRDMRAED